MDAVSDTRSRKVRVKDLGLSDYGSVYQAQLIAVAALREVPEAEEQLFLVEHPDVYTFGRKSKSGVKPLGQARCFEIERGGDATYHNPGQLVAYPILKLLGEEQDIHGYLRKLELVLIDLLAEFGVPAGSVAGATGVWVGKGTRKIASIGVAIRGWVTFHGIALNVENDLSGFHKIDPCGFSASMMTSLKAELGAGSPSMELVKSRFLTRFLRVFGRVAAR